MMMNKDKQIEEMAMLMTEGARPSVEDAEALYNAGYRKASDVINEIIEVIDDLYIKVHEVLEKNLKDFSPNCTKEGIFALVDILKRKTVEKIKLKYESENRE